MKDILPDYEDKDIHLDRDAVSTVAQYTGRLSKNFLALRTLLRRGSDASNYHFKALSGCDLSRLFDCIIKISL